MKQPNHEQSSGRNQNLRRSNKKSKCMPQYGAKMVREKDDCAEYRRKTRLQILSENGSNAVNAHLEFSEVSIQTLHSICAPKGSHQQVKKKNLHQANITRNQNVFQQHDHRSSSSSVGLLSSSKQNIFCTSKTCSTKESTTKALCCVEGAEEANVASQSSKDAVIDLWLEVSVEIDHGINLVVDLNLDSATDRLQLEKNSCMLVLSDIAAGDLQRCHAGDSQANDFSDAPCTASRCTAEAPSTDTVAQNNDQLLTSKMVDCDTGSKTTRLGVSAACASVESQESSTSEMKELRNEGFSFASLERMPTFLATGIQGPFRDDSKLDGDSDWVVVYVEA